MINEYILTKNTNINDKVTKKVADEIQQIFFKHKHY